MCFPGDAAERSGKRLLATLLPAVHVRLLLWEVVLLVVQDRRVPAPSAAGEARTVSGSSTLMATGASPPPFIALSSEPLSAALDSRPAA